MNRLLGTNPLSRYEIASGSTVEIDDLVALNAAGKALPASGGAGETVLGVARRVFDGTAEIDSGIVGLYHSGITTLNRGGIAYVAEKNLVTATKPASNAAPVGIIVDVDDDLVYVEVTPLALATAKARMIADETQDSVEEIAEDVADDGTDTFSHTGITSGDVAKVAYAAGEGAVTATKPVSNPIPVGIIVSAAATTVLVDVTPTAVACANALMIAEELKAAAV